MPVHLDADNRRIQLDGRWYPVARHRVETVDLPPDLDSPPHRTRQALVPVGETGWELSIVWGTGTYSDNHACLFPPSIGGSEFVEDPDRVEIAAFNRDGIMVDWADGDTVQGYVVAAEVAHILDRLADLPADLTVIPL